MSSYSRKDNREEKAFLTPGMVWLCYVYSGGSGRPGVVGVILEWLCSHSWYAKGHTPGWLRCDGHDAGYGKWPRSHSRMPEGRAYYGEAYMMISVLRWETRRKGIVRGSSCLGIMGVVMDAATVSRIRVLQRHVATVGGMGVRGYLGWRRRPRSSSYRVSCMGVMGMSWGK